MVILKKMVSWIRALFGYTKKVTDVTFTEISKKLKADRCLHHWKYGLRSIHEGRTCRNCNKTMFYSPGLRKFI